MMLPQKANNHNVLFTLSDFILFYPILVVRDPIEPYFIQIVFCETCQFKCNAMYLP
jgi:hypothetical protein